MTPKKPPRNLTPPLCERLRQDMLAACSKVAGRHGLVVEGGDLSDVNLRCGIGIRFRSGIPGPDGSLFEPEKALFEALAESYGLQPTDFARTFTTGGETFRITAINPKRPKCPISVERLPDRRGYKFTAENAAMYLKASEEHTGS